MLHKVESQHTDIESKLGVCMRLDHGVPEDNVFAGILSLLLGRHEQQETFGAAVSHLDSAWHTCEWCKTDELGVMPDGFGQRTGCTSKLRSYAAEDTTYT